MKRAQSSIEFMILVGVAMLFTALFISILSSRFGDNVSEKRDFVLKETATTLDSEINLAMIAQDGYSRQFILPENIINNDYEIRIVDDFVYARTLDGKHALSIKTLNVTGQPLKGENIIRNMGGAVYLN